MLVNTCLLVSLSTSYKYVNLSELDSKNFSNDASLIHRWPIRFWLSSVGPLKYYESYGWNRTIVKLVHGIESIFIYILNSKSLQKIISSTKFVIFCVWIRQIVCTMNPDYTFRNILRLTAYLGSREGRGTKCKTENSCKSKLLIA